MRHRATALIALAALLGACGQTPAAAPEPPEIKLYAMDCGHISVSDSDMFADDGSYKNVAADLVVPCYLIRHPQGDLIWDTGVPEAIADLPDGISEQGSRITMGRKLTAQLAELGLAPGDIDLLSISHSHFDHAGNAGLFASATWIVDPDERAYMFRDEARADPSFSAYAALENVTPRLMEGDSDLDVFGDGSITIIQAPGHTPGHTVLLLRLRNAGPILLTGDLWHIAASREARRVPRFNTDRAQTLASMDRFERIAAETRARVIIQHVPEDFASLPAFPAYLD